MVKLAVFFLVTETGAKRNHGMPTVVTSATYNSYVLTSILCFFCWTLPTALWNRFIFITWLYNSVYENQHVRRCPAFSGRKEIWIPSTWPQTENHPGTAALHVKPRQCFSSSLLIFNSCDKEELRNQLQPINASKLHRNFFLLPRSGAS